MALTKKVSMPVLAGLAVAIGLVGGMSINSLSANAATASTGTTATSAGSATTAAATTDNDNDANRPAQSDPSKGGHRGSNGTTEAILTGDTATKVQAAALAAVPGGTIQRMENDAEGATYEAHMTKADGSRVTVKLDSSFKVTSTEDGMR